ncbi:MAG TPA: hypothetical protein VK464_10720 [Symbiobacteriaceae bacterium]|nr:hypothetical protein [Symbiobacteriaceae bacterium]
MKRRKVIATALALVLAGSVVGYQVSNAAEKAAGTTPPKAGPLRRAYWKALGIKTAPLKLRVVDATTMKGINGAGCTIGETGDRVETDAQGMAPAIDAPIFRNPRLEQMLAELHGQLVVLCYKNGYRDSIYMGVRMHENTTTETEVWMYPYGPRDRRIEPTLYQVPIHRVWRIELADKYRLREEGEGPERPQLTRPDMGQVPPQTPEGLGVQTPPFSGPSGGQPAPGAVPAP